MTKKCTKCGGDGPFGVDRRHTDGLQSWCRACLNAATHTNYVKNPEKAKLYSRKWNKEHPEKAKASNLKNNRKYRLVHHEQLLEKGRIRRTTHPEMFAQSNRKYQIEHPEKVKEFNHRRRTKKLHAEGSFTSQQWLELRIDYGNRCAYCNKSNNALEPDHVIPLSKYGSNDISNIVPACPSCNRSKGNKSLLVWMLDRLYGGDLLYKPEQVH
jgi:5-methylcytosine-specific restriction endonuclease McrA